MMNKLDKKWQLKIICLLMAIVLWFFIINEQNPMSEGSYTVPIVVENLDSQYITSNVPKTVYVRLSGPRNTIINVGPSDIKAYIDLSDAQEGEMSAPVRIEIPAGTELKKQSMTSADIMVDVYTVRELALTPHLVGQTKNDIFVSSLKVVPEKVVISGARRLVKQVEQAVVEIPIEDRIDDFSIMAPIRLVAADGSRVEGGLTVLYPENQVMPIFDASREYLKRGTPCIVFGGEEYGTGSSRDWAAKGTKLLGISAVIVKSFERIHRSNLVGMGVLPLEFINGDGTAELGITGRETFDILGLEHLRPQGTVELVIHREDGSSTRVPLKVRVDTPVELTYLKANGILPFMLARIAEHA